jgi:transcriptional regulator of acetoin/glycerol metabolism
MEHEQEQIIKRLHASVEDLPAEAENLINHQKDRRKEREEDHILDTEEIVEESLSLEDKEIELIIKALEKHNGKRKYAAQDLGISERTLYRKIKEYNIE